MRIDQVQLQNLGRLINDYRNNDSEISQYFDYSPFNDYEQRVSDLRDRVFNRKELTEVLYAVNEQWGAPDSTYNNIERLNDEKSVVVIGGQQAGLMTGPLYTINKVISIIQFARQQESILNIPVIPVFWIAGEDHDYDEINHIYLLENSGLKKHTLLQRVAEKESISNVKIDETYAQEWLDQLFKQLNETSYTKDLYRAVKDCLDESNTYTDFFARLIYQLFAEEGIVLIDSAHPRVRRLESEHFVTLIENQTDISNSVYTAFQQLSKTGYSIALDVEQDDAHLFYHKGNERILLERNEEGNWIGKQLEVELTTEELIQIARKTPELLSNNVVSRPLMQELLFPSLAFVAGNGEINYWAVLKPAFHTLNIKMPPVLPRLSFTYMNQKLEKTLRKFAIKSEDAINVGVAESKGNWLAGQNNPPIHHMVTQLKIAIDDAHRPLRNVAKGVRVDLGDLANKNLVYLQREIDHLEDRINNAIEEKYAAELADFDLINNSLNPFGGLQERIWSPLQLINESGPDFLRKLISEQCSFEQEHFLVYV